MNLNHESLAELLRDYAALNGGRALYLTIRPADSWELIHRYAFPFLGEFVAVRDEKRAQYWIITDAVSMKDFPATAREIPTAGPELVLLWSRELGTEADRWEVSPGWAASARRLAALMAADA